MPTRSNRVIGLCNVGGVLLLLGMASPSNADEPWKRFEPKNPDWVEAGHSPRAKFFIDQNEMQIEGAVVWAFEQAVYTPGVKFLNPDSDPKHSGPIRKAIFLLEFLCERNTYREVNTTYWYENGGTWDSGYPNLLAHGQIDIDNPIFQYMANLACAKRKSVVSQPASTTTPGTPARAAAVSGGAGPSGLPESALDEAIQLAAKGDFQKAHDVVPAFADQGNARAQIVLGTMYEFGKGESKDPVQAAVWYRKAADQGNARAEKSLGVLYENGQGVDQDYAAAAEWYRKSANHGYAEGQYNLATMLAKGKGVSQSAAEAFGWMQKAADQGLAIAQYQVGVMHQLGQGTAQDSALAVAWFRRAADQGNPEAQAGLGYAYSVGRGVPKDEAEALTWYRKSADQGNANAQAALRILNSR